MLLLFLDGPDGAWIGLHEWIMGQEEEPFDRGLGDKDTVKRVAMNIGKLSNCHGMLTGDGEVFIPVLDEATTQQMRINLEVCPAKPGLDRDFPQACGAKHQDVQRVFHECPGIGGEFPRVSGCPQEQVGIEQKPHACPSNSTPISSCPI